MNYQKRAPKPVHLLSVSLQDPVPYPRRVRPTIPVDEVRVVDGRERTIYTIEGKETKDTDTVTVFVAKDGDEWKVLLHPEEFATFGRGGCPYEDPDLLKGPDPPEGSGPNEFSTPESFD